MKSIFIVIREIFQKYCIVILIGVAMALLVASPHLRALTSMGIENFRGVYPMFSDDEVTYLARIKEVVDGHVTVGNPYIQEHMDDPFIMPPLAEWTFAFFSRVTGTPVPFIMSVSDGVLGFTCFILVYILFQTLTRNLWISLLYTLLFFFFSLATFGRPISPQFNALFLLVGLIVTTKTYFSPELWGRKWNMSAGLIAGITCFISPYYFTALLGFYVVVFTLRAISERSVEVVKKNIPWFFVAFLPLALVYTFLQLKASHDPSYSETVLRYGLIHTHVPGSFTNMLFGGIALGVLVLCFKSLSNQKFVFALGSLFTLFALNWQNILTGKSLQFSSHYLFTSILLIFISFALIHTAFVRREMVNFGVMRKSLIIAGMVFLVVIIGHNQKDEYMNLGKTLFTREELLDEQKRMDVFNWFNTNTELDSVVYTLGGRYDFMLPIYAHNKVFYNFYAALYPAFGTETEERWLIQNIFNAEMSTTTIREHQREYWGNTYIDSYQSRENRKKIYAFFARTPYVREEDISETQIEYMYERWLDISTRPLEENLTKYELDYILISRDYPYYNKTVAQLERMNAVTFVADVSGNRVYRVK